MFFVYMVIPRNQSKSINFHFEIKSQVFKTTGGNFDIVVMDGAESYDECHKKMQSYINTFYSNTGIDSLTIDLSVASNNDMELLYDYIVKKCLVSKTYISNKMEIHDYPLQAF